MKATLTKTNFIFKAIAFSRPDDSLILEWKVLDLADIAALVDCKKLIEPIDIAIYYKRGVYSCCIWIHTTAVQLLGNGKANTPGEALNNAFSSIGIEFDEPLPDTDPISRPEKMVSVAIDAIAIELGIKQKVVVPFIR